MASNTNLQTQHNPLSPALVPPWPSPETLDYVSRRLDITNFRHGLPWHNCDYYPAPERRGRGRKIRAAKQLIRENQRNTGLCRLPTELLMWVGDRLSGGGLAGSAGYVPTDAILRATREEY